MKQGIHPDYVAATVECHGCGNRFQTRATTSNIEVEICAECHPFYTGKQKLVDVAGRVDRFRAHQEAAAQKTDRRKKQEQKAAKEQADSGEASSPSRNEKKLQDLKDNQENTSK
jgi:large subunit ribosomal protein L31